MSKYRICTNDRFRDIEKSLIFGKLEFIPKIISIHKKLILHFCQYCHTNKLCNSHIRKLRRRADKQTDRQTYLIYTLALLLYCLDMNFLFFICLETNICGLNKSNDRVTPLLRKVQERRGKKRYKFIS